MDSSRPKSEAEDDVYEHITSPVECVQDYVPGGLHPVYLGDTVGDGRYKMLRKLGYGGFSTVWLAQDNKENDSLVALKIVRADTDCAKEIKCYEILRANKGNHPGYSCVMMLKDQFSIQGPNGNHDCLTYEVLGPSIADVLQDCHDVLKTAYFTLSCARRIVHQVLLGLDYMHSVGLVHGDLYPSNVLFAVNDLSQEPMDILCQPYDQVSDDVKRINGPQQPGDPRHLTLNRALIQFLSPDGNVKLSDLGSSFFENDPPNKAETPAEIRSPEMILGDHVSMAQDDWAFGYFVYYVLTSCRLIDLGFIYNKDSRDDAHLIQLFTLLGPLPSKLKHCWPRYGVYFDNEGRLKHFDVNDDPLPDIELGNTLQEDDGHSTTSDSCQAMNNDLAQRIDEEPPITPPDYIRPSHEWFDPKLYPSIIKFCEREKHEHQDFPLSLAEFITRNPPLREKWMDEKHPDMQLEESELVLDFLQGLFQYDPNRRFSTKELLQHAWIRHYCALDSGYGELSEETAVVHRNKKERPITDAKSQ